MNRRELLRRSAAAAMAAAWLRWSGAEPAPRAGRAKPPFRLLYDNDLTNVVECTSPFHPKGAEFQPEMLEASVDEAAAAGADAQLLQPGLTFVPMWRSKLYPADEHARWWQQTFQGSLHPVLQYMLEGGDCVRVFVDRCRARGSAAFVSVRLNDYHRLEAIDATPGRKLERFDSLAIDRFRREHPEYRLERPNDADVSTRPTQAVYDARDCNVLNWAIPEVRQRMLGFISELCANYELDGLELDYLRHFRFFRSNQTPAAQRVAIMTRFIADVRAELDRVAHGGKRRWLGARVPAVLGIHRELGIDLAAMTAAGVDMFNLSSNYYTVQQDVDVAAARQAAPEAAIYLEMTHATVVGADSTRGRGDSTLVRRTTAEQFQTTAHLACARGADGVSLFNFAYYREYGRPERGPFAEPPFNVLRRLIDRQGLARSSQHYFLSSVWRSPYGNEVQLPKRCRPGRPTSLRLDMAPPAGGWSGAGVLRMQTDQSAEGTMWAVKLNGVTLKPNDDVSEPFPNPYPAMLGTKDSLRAWAVPADQLMAGENAIEITLLRGAAAVTIVFLDLAVPGRSAR